jgi:hypothetical protein
MVWKVNRSTLRVRSFLTRRDWTHLKDWSNLETDRWMRNGRYKTRTCDLYDVNVAL